MTQLKFYNCHVKRSEIWLVLSTPGQRKSTVWTRLSCQAVFLINSQATRLPTENPCGNVRQHSGGLLHTSAGCECGRCWPYMEVLASKWLQLSPISIHISNSGPRVIGQATIWLARSNNSVVSRKAPECCLTLPDRFSIGFSGWSRDKATTDADSPSS